MSIFNSSQLTFGQQEAISRVLIRRKVPIPTDGQKVIDWLLDSNQLITAAAYTKKILSESGPNAPTHGALNQRRIAFCSFDTFDPITTSRADALDAFLEALSEDPTLLTDRKLLRATVREINRIHESSLEEAHSALTDSLQRFNDNLALGRPLVQCLENLFGELDPQRIFCCFARRDELGGVFKDIWNKGVKFVEAARDGKTYPDEVIYPLITTLHETLSRMYLDETNYWYHEDMIRAYARDTLLPHAVLNGYIEPNETTDVYGALWRFVRDFTTKSTLLVCPPLLFHQPKQPGPRYIGVSEVVSELRTKRLNPKQLPHLEYRLTVKLQEKGFHDQFNDTALSSRAPFEYPFLRLSHSIDYIPFLLENLGESFVRYVEVLRRWLPTTFWAIDPGFSVAGRHLQSVLSSLVDPIINQQFRAPSVDQSLKLLQSFQESFQTSMENIIGILRGPIEHYDGDHKTALEPYEIRESLVNVALLGIFQPHSDWPEELSITSAFVEAVESAAKFEIEPDTPINKIQTVEKIEKLIESLEPYYIRVMQLTLDPLALELWTVLNFYSISTINTIRIGRLLDPDVTEDLLIPLNLPAFSEALSGKAADILLDLCRRIEKTVMTEGAL